MAGAVVLMFLLDNVKDDPKQFISPLVFDNTSIEKCDPLITPPILEAISDNIVQYRFFNELPLGSHVDLPQNYWFYDNSLHVSNENNLDPDLHEKIETNFAREKKPTDISFLGFDEQSGMDSVPLHSKKHEVKDTDTPDDLYMRNMLNTTADDSENIPLKEMKPDIHDTAERTVVERKVEKYPNMAPCLVAIFETVSNLTALTCAGSLVAPQWVLTAAGCVDLMHDMLTGPEPRSNHYTIIVNATNPLMDGTIHNVSRIVFTPEWELTNKTRGPNIALMKIDPPADSFGVPVLSDNEDWNNTEVQAYGWAKNNKSGNDEVKLVTLSSRLAPEPDCRANYSRGPVLCLSCGKDNNDELSTGGPVLAIVNSTIQLLGVVQTTEECFMVSYPVYSYREWLKYIIGHY